MIGFVRYTLLCISPIIFNTRSCTAVEPPYLQLSADGEQEYSDVVVRRVGEELSLVCELIGDGRPRPFVWNYIPADETAEQRPYTVSPSNASLSSTLSRGALREADSGRYLCSAPPFSLYKHVEVQTPGVKQCARGAFSCGTYCVLALYVCDGRADCASGEDEAPAMCDRAPCSRADKLNCSSGRCVPWRACCRGGAPLCRQPACCDEHPPTHDHPGFEVEYPPLFEDRHAPDDYGFIQSTIYTVTACALIFMIAVVLLVSAICKMQMKRAALRHYARAERDTARHYGQHYAQTARFPPCYEASRLLEDARPAEPASDAPADTAPTLQCSPSCTDEGSGGFALSRLSAVFAARYRQVPTQCLDVEMTDVHSSPTANSSPRRQRPLDNYRSPTFCETDDFLFNPETSSCGRDLNYMATPIEFFRRRTLRNLGNLTDTRSRPLTLQLGRFQLSIPRLGRRTSLERRPDTPNVAEMNIDDLDFVRLNSNETYTLNGRTIRLLGANFENYPGGDGGTRPPPYNEAMRYKLYGPPPEYLSRDGLNTNSGTPNTEEQARSNIEMPPCYEDLASGGDANANASGSDNVDNDNGNHVASGNDTSNAVATENVSTNNVSTDNAIASVTIDSNVAGCNVFNGNVEVEVTENLSSVIDNLPAIDSDVNANEAC